ncbi:MAG TPA: hypothetical protein GX521_08535, partial [Firmicutes bacterium]|nr:hypothetical protein [Bacillota bacterium]
MPLFNDLERVKLRFITTCEGLVAQGRLEEQEFQAILNLLDAMNDYDDQQFKAELSRISKGI